MTVIKEVSGELNQVEVHMRTDTLGDLFIVLSFFPLLSFVSFCQKYVSMDKAGDVPNRTDRVEESCRDLNLSFSCGKVLA